MNFLLLVSICAICITGRPFVKAAPQPATNTGTDSSSTADLANILSAFNGGSDIDSALALIKDFQQAGDLYKRIMQISPLAKQVLNDAAKTNAKIRVLVAVADGKIPDLKDLFEIATSKTDSVSTDFTAVLANNKQFQEVLALMSKTDFATSKDDVEEFLLLITGQHIDLQSTMPQDPKTGQFVVTTKAGDKYRNLVEVALHIQENWKPFMDNQKLTMANPVDYVAILKNTLNSHYTHLTEIHAPTSDKYTVSGSGVAKMDPDVSALIQLVKTGSSMLGHVDQTKAHELNIELSRKNIAIYEKVFTEALASPPGEQADNSALVG